MLNKLLTSIAWGLAEKLVSFIMELFNDWREERAVKKEIKKNVEILRQVKTPEEIRAAVRNLLP